MGGRSGRCSSILAHPWDCPRACPGFRVPRRARRAIAEHFYFTVLIAIVQDQDRLKVAPPFLALGQHATYSRKKGWQISLARAPGAETASSPPRQI